MVKICKQLLLKDEAECDLACLTFDSEGKVICDYEECGSEYKELIGEDEDERT